VLYEISNFTSSCVSDWEDQVALGRPFYRNGATLRGV
jgi:hypothetical protein